MIADGDPLSYSWQQIEGETVSITNIASDTLNFTAPMVVDNKILRFKITVSDGNYNVVQEVNVGVRKTSQIAGIYYYHNDHLGTPQIMSDEAANVVWQASYSPFGKAEMQIETITNKIRFPGQYFDSETGLHYNYFRDYDPEVGRYITSDPIGLAGGINTYGYVLQNPLSFIDPTGLDWIYSQSTGQMTQTTNGQTQQGQGGTGYAGNGDGYNNSAAQNQTNVGPLPQGTYTIGDQTDSPNTGPGILPLIPNTMFGRDSFQIHGDNSAMNQTASDGCIVLGLNIRNQIANSGDNILIVEP